jgi:RNA polymerase sigma-70 factor (ECF subfamily)
MMGQRPPKGDDQWMREFQEGDVPAFEELLARWRGPLLALARSLTEDWATADDIVQETFVRVYEQRREYIPSGRFPSWICTIARNLCYDKLREPAPLALEPDMPLVLWLGASGGRPEPATESVADERLAQVERAAEKLPPPMREAVMLKYYHGLKIKEIAEIQDCPAGTVKSRLHYARKRMEELVSALNPDFQ